MGLSAQQRSLGQQPDISREALPENTRRWLGLLLLAAGVFAYLTLIDGGEPLQEPSLPSRPTGLALAEWRAAPLVVQLSEGEDGQLTIEAQTEFEAGVGTVSVWVETAAERAEFVNYDTLYPGERSAAWLGGLPAGVAAAHTVTARHRGKLTQAARDFGCERQEGEGESAGEATWVCEGR